MYGDQGRLETVVKENLKKNERKGRKENDILPSSLDSFQTLARVDFDHYFSTYSLPGCFSLSLLLFKFTLTIDNFFLSLSRSLISNSLILVGSLHSAAFYFSSPLPTPTASIGSLFPGYYAHFSNLSLSISS